MTITFNKGATLRNLLNMMQGENAKHSYLDIRVQNYGTVYMEDNNIAHYPDALLNCQIEAIFNAEQIEKIVYVTMQNAEAWAMGETDTIIY